jgi:hypothetical protein
MTIPRSPIFGRVPDLPFSGELGETAYLQKLFRKDLCSAARIYRRKFVLIINASITAQASAKRRYSTVWRCSPGPRAPLPTAARPPGAVSRQRRRAHLCRRIAGNASSRAPTTPPTPGPGRAVCPSGWLVPHTTLARCRWRFWRDGQLSSAADDGYSLNLEANSTKLRPSIRAEADDRLEDAEPRCSPFGIGRTKSPLCRAHFRLLDTMPGD